MRQRRIKAPREMNQCIALFKFYFGNALKNWKANVK